MRILRPTVLAVCGAVFALAAAIGLSSSALAGCPLATNDPDTPGRNEWEINVSHNIERTRSELIQNVPNLNLNYGFFENDQWKANIPLQLADPSDDRQHLGIGDVQIGWKYQFLEEDETGFGVSIYPQLLVPTGNESLGLGNGQTESL